MVPSLRERFNREYSPVKYRKFLDDLNQVCGTPTAFRVSETPCFLPATLLQKMCDYGRELTLQLVNDPKYRKASDAAVPAQYNVPNESALPKMSCSWRLIRTSRRRCPIF